MFVTIKVSFYFQVHNFHLAVIIDMGKVALQNERLLKTAQNLQFRKLNLTNFDIVAPLKNANLWKFQFHWTLKQKSDILKIDLLYIPSTFLSLRESREKQKSRDLFWYFLPKFAYSLYKCVTQRRRCSSYFQLGNSRSLNFRNSFRLKELCEFRIHRLLLNAERNSRSSNF